jgi:DnaK suppressor protein
MGQLSHRLFGLWAQVQRGLMHVKAGKLVRSHHWQDSRNTAPASWRLCVSPDPDPDPTEHFMNASFQIDAVRQQLLAQRQSLLNQIAELRGGLVGRAQGAEDLRLQPGDSPAQNLSERDLHFALDEHDTAEVVAIDAALERLNEGVWGRCTDCGEDIAPARLQAAPEAARCIGCQTHFEAQHSAA